MKKEDIGKNVKEKFLFEGLTSSGKTNISLKIAKLYLLNDKRVVFIDPEHGADRDIEVLFNDLTDEQLERFELISATNIETYLKYMLGWTEERRTANELIKIEHGLNCDLKVCDGLVAEIGLYKARLTQKFLKQGYYTIGDKNFTISNPETFVLPYNFYGKLYDQIVEALIVMMDHKYDIICTTHPFKETESQQALEQIIYAKFDSVIRLNKLTLTMGTPKWTATIIKNRGKEAPNKTNVLDTVDPILKYFIKKFNMDEKEGLKRLGIE